MGTHCVSDKPPTEPIFFIRFPIEVVTETSLPPVSFGCPSSLFYVTYLQHEGAHGDAQEDVQQREEVEGHRAQRHGACRPTDGEEDHREDGVLEASDLELLRKHSTHRWSNKNTPNPTF